MSREKSPAADSHVSGQANRPLTRPAHALSADEVTVELGTNSIDGLSPDEAARRVTEHGRNEFGEPKSVQPFKIFISQIANALTPVMVLAAGASFGVGSWIEGGVIFAVVVLNIVVGFVQEMKAAKTMDSLRSLSSPTASAVRDGFDRVVPTAEIVPGDVVELKMGDTIPADIRIVEAANFETNEALLTGESLPVRKEASMIFEDETGPGDRLNIAFSSSTVTKGRARGVVFATGLYTEIGQIAAALGDKPSRRRAVKRRPDGTANSLRYMEAWGLTLSDAAGRFLGINVGTPLHRKLSRVAILLFFLAVVCTIIVLAANKFNTSQPEVITYAVATGLSMIPASLVVVLTITMAAGTKRMVKRHVIVRNLKSLEALGAVTNICSDKTGTLTQGKMVAKRAWLPGHGTYSVANTSEPCNPTVGELAFRPLAPKDIDFQEPGADGEKVSSKAALESTPVLQDYLNVASLANLAIVHESGGTWHARGDPTEIAIQVFASRFRWNRLGLTSGPKPRWTAVAELPFDSDVKMMSVVFEQADTHDLHIFTKGAVEKVVDACDSVALADGDDPMTDAHREEIARNAEALARLGLRVLALASHAAVRPLGAKEEPDRAELERGLVFRGLLGLYDPPRPESAPSVRRCHEAGIAVHMLTGDHPETARAIALEVGILPSHRDVSHGMVMAAADFDALGDADIDRLPFLPLVLARCAPNTKVRMIAALHRRQRFVAMTGDGVNDSPSLRRADVGIAMGQSGSDVAKEASDIVLTDDNFASILNAVEEGRRMFDNIQKFILHVLAENIAQAATLLSGLAFKDNAGLSVFPLAPVQILWIIMITSGMPDMGLGFEPAAADIMQRPPHNLKQGIFTPELLLDMVVYGVWMSALCLSSFVLVTHGFGNGSLGENCNNGYFDGCQTVFRARATVFACLTWFALFLAWEIRHPRRSFFRMQPHDKHSLLLTGWMYDVWRNRFLFWAVVAGFVTIFPTLYIPVIDLVIFKHEGITWEWGIVFIETVVFFTGIEAWKWGKRVYFRRSERKATGGSTVDLESRVFGPYYDADAPR